MNSEDRLIAALESLGNRVDQLGEKLDAMARIDIARASDDDAKLHAIRQFVTDFLYMKEKLEFIAQNTPTRKRRLRVAR